MKKLILLFFSLLVQLVSAQFVTLSKAVKTSENKDKFFYKINPTNDPAEYLGEIEVDGFTNNDAETFNTIYKKAKTIGANSFSLKSVESIDGSRQEFNQAHYFISLYYAANLPKEDNVVYLINSSEKLQKVRINSMKIQLLPRSYRQLELPRGEVVSVSSGKFLGSRILLAHKHSQPVQYFQILPAGVRADQTGYHGGLNIKSGDIIMLEKSYAQFLTAIYSNNSN